MIALYGSTAPWATRQCSCPMRALDSHRRGTSLCLDTRWSMGITNEKLQAHKLRMDGIGDLSAPQRGRPTLPFWMRRDHRTSYDRIRPNAGTSFLNQSYHSSGRSCLRRLHVICWMYTSQTQDRASFDAHHRTSSPAYSVKSPSCIQHIQERRRLPC